MRVTIRKDGYVWVHGRGNRGTVVHVAVFDPAKQGTRYETRHRFKISRARSPERMPKWLNAALKMAAKDYLPDSVLPGAVKVTLNDLNPPTRQFVEDFIQQHGATLQELKRSRASARDRDQS